MRIEAFSEGKHLDDPDANEDQFLILPGRGYAVFDGVTDITGRIFYGMRTGRLASRAVQRAAAAFLCRDADTLKTPKHWSTELWQHCARSTRGTAFCRMRTDDRTVVIVHL